MTDHARRSDPASSDRTVKSIVKDGALADLILKAMHHRVVYWYLYETEPSDHAVCDTYLWERLEARTGRRLQRNVIARARGRLVTDGLLVGVGARDYNGQELEHYVLTDPTNKGAAA
ncbi:MAG TPA: hypothetical protein PLT40_17265 [Ilumatobacteraceae bacterium]|nr:hypothetical protein [Ilumatobacteraceae bacterium]